MRNSMRSAVGRTVGRISRLRIASQAVVLYQHKPYGYLSPSTAPEGNKLFALDLLTGKNFSGGPWVTTEAEPHEAGEETEARNGGVKLRPVNARDVPGLKAAGRLDADSTGLMVWSDDSSLVSHIIGQASEVEKEYLVRVSGHASWTSAQLDTTLDQLREGMHLDGKPLKRADVARVNEAQLRFTLTEGCHRQIRRMCALVGLQVEAIKRVRIGKLQLKGLAVGNWVALKPKQAAVLFGLTDRLNSVHNSPFDARGRPRRPPDPRQRERRY